MPAFQFDSNGIDPSYGAGGSQLPAGKHPVVIVASELKPTKDGQGGYMALTLEAIDGPSKGVQHTDRLNLHNKSADAVRIANGQLSAYCHVIGVFRFQSTEELHGKPFVVEIGLDAKSTNGTNTEVKKIYDINGNEPGKGGAGAAANGNGGFGNASGGNGGNTAQGDPNAGNPGNGGGNGWGGAGNGAGANGGGASAGGNGAWSQGAGANGNGGGSPGWGQR